jgi:hypothetical protein
MLECCLCWIQSLWETSQPRSLGSLCGRPRSSLFKRPRQLPTVHSPKLCANLAANTWQVTVPRSQRVRTASAGLAIRDRSDFLWSESGGGRFLRGTEPLWSPLLALSRVVDREQGCGCSKPVFQCSKIMKCSNEAKASFVRHSPNRHKHITDK